MFDKFKKEEGQEMVEERVQEKNGSSCEEGWFLYGCGIKVD